MKSTIGATAAFAAMALAGGASAEIGVLAQFHYDFWAGEVGWSIVDAASNVVATLVLTPDDQLVAEGLAVVSQSFSLWGGAGTSFSDGYRHLVEMSLAAGEYTILMTDSFGDGWVNANVTGADALEFLELDGVLNVTPAGPFAFGSGSSVSYSFTVVPAPGAIALLGVAGLVGSRRRRA